MNTSHPLANRPGPARQVAGFTIVELMVVIAIIALLVSLLLPALAQVRKTSQTMVCASQLRSLMTIYHIYASDHSGRLVSHHFYEYEGQSAPGYYWYTNRNSKGQFGLAGYLPTYAYNVKPKSGWFCPSDGYLAHPGRDSTKVQTYLLSRTLQHQTNGAAGINGQFVKYRSTTGSLSSGWNRLDTVVTPHSRVAAISDGTYYVRPNGMPATKAGFNAEFPSRQSGGGFRYSTLAPSKGWLFTGTGPDADATHHGSPHPSESANFGFLDGHVQTMNLDGVISTYMKGVNVTATTAVDHPWTYNR
mgnify:CR=1 FL=1